MLGSINKTVIEKHVVDLSKYLENKSKEYLSKNRKFVLLQDNLSKSLHKSAENS